MRALLPTLDRHRMHEVRVCLLLEFVTMAVLLLLFSILAPVAKAQTGEPMVYVYNGPESTLDTRYRYQLEILTAVLEGTKDKYGPYVLKPAVTMTQDREAYELAHNTGRITVIIRSGHEEYGGRLFRQVPIPIDKGVLGYRVLLIRKEDQARFSKVRSLEDLKTFSMGAETDWKDVGILKANGLNVVSGHSYEGLFGMLAKGRFDALSRSVVEVGDEYEAHAVSMPDLAIEKSLLLYFPLPRFFWFSNDVSGELLAARVREGLNQILHDGTLDRIFHRHYDAELAALDIRKRRLIRLDNPYFSPDGVEQAGNPQGDRLPNWFPVGGGQ